MKKVVVVGVGPLFLWFWDVHVLDQRSEAGECLLLAILSWLKFSELVNDDSRMLFSLY